MKHISLRRSHAEELFNTVTHGVGVVLSVVGVIFLVTRVLAHGDTWQIAGCGLYAMTLVALYIASTLSHMPTEPRWKRWFRTLDQGFIYLLIAGTYTPFALAYLRTGWWWVFFCVVWTIALAGFLSKILLAHRIEAVSIATYIVLGWLPVLSARTLLEHVPAIALWWMLIGGLCYTIGTAFLICDRKSQYFHAIWHMFVVAGSAWHYFAILFFVAGAS